MVRVLPSRPKRQQSQVRQRTLDGFARRAARGVLAQGCPLDLHPRAFRAGACAQSLLAGIDVLLHQRDDAPSYDLQVRWSHAAYLWAWLAAAAQGAPRA